ncbi:DUF2157 domain-containing protein [Brevibacillus marinus]|uniref:DUF2157 domain-containing protein n=1 Tax=Brevibacillus marinus TaxID=2496837 RepID=UPI000F81C4D8|nr:DUF2157 domain-containing protein [Brevibacillus marinus]
MAIKKRSVILQEAEQWKREGIISEEQFRQIAARYPAGARPGTLPIMGGILLGLGVLTFIASNWDGMSHAVRLFVILAALLAAYLAGESLRRSGKESLGMAFTVLGVAIYGAGFFLIGQMYHLSGNLLTPFYLWFIGAVSMAWHYRSRVLALFSLLILAAAAFYGLGTDARAGMQALILYALYVGLLPLLGKLRSGRLLAAAYAMLLATAILDAAEYGSGLLIQLPMLAYLLASVLLPARLAPIPALLRTVSYIAVTLFAVYVGLTGEPDLYVNPLDTFGLAAILLAVLGYGYVCWRAKRFYQTADLLPYLPLPLSYLFAAAVEDSAGSEPLLGQDVAMILAMYAFSIALVLGGEKGHDVQRINTGALVFGVTSFVAYVNFAWDFMDKSLFFLFGGALLLLLSFLLERQRRRWVERARRDAP